MDVLLFLEGIVVDYVEVCHFDEWEHWCPNETIHVFVSADFGRLTTVSEQCTTRLVGQQCHHPVHTLQTLQHNCQWAHCWLNVSESYFEDKCYD